MFRKNSNNIFSIISLGSTCFLYPKKAISVEKAKLFIFWQLIIFQKYQTFIWNMKLNFLVTFTNPMSITCKASEVTIWWRAASFRVRILELHNDYCHFTTYLRKFLNLKSSAKFWCMAWKFFTVHLSFIYQLFCIFNCWTL